MNEVVDIKKLAETYTQSAFLLDLTQRVQKAWSVSKKDDEWELDLLDGLMSSVFEEYKRMSTAFSQGSLSLISYHGRNLTELSVLLKYCLISRDNTRTIYEDSSRDALELLKVIESWGINTEQKEEWFAGLPESVDELKIKTEKLGFEDIEKPYQRIHNIAKNMNINNHFALPYKMMSKFAHPTALLLQIKGTKIEKNILPGLYELGCIYFAESVRDILILLKRIESSS